MGKNGGGGSVTLDTVMIKIETESGKAASNIGNLAKNLENLKNSIKGARYSNLNKLSEALERLVPSLQKLGSTSNISESIANITNGLSQLKSVASPTGFAKAVNSLEKFPEVINKIDTKTFENLKRVSEELSKSLEPLADKMDKVAQGYSAFSKIQNTFGKSATTVTRYAKQEKSILGELSKTISRGSKSVVQFASGLTNAFGKKSINNLKSFHSKFKQVYLSLLGTRTLFTMIRKAASEYMNFDKTLQKFSTNVWRAFGAQLAPALEYAMYLFKQFVRVIYSVIYALTGIDLIARANAKAMQGWSKAAKDTLGNLQKFDDLNVVEFPKGKGDDELIEMDKIDLSPIQKVIDWVKKLKEEIQAALDTGEWYNVGKVFGEGISEGIAYLNDNIQVVRDTLYGVAIDFGDALNGVIENTRWSEIGTFVTNALTLLPNTITELLKTIHWDEIGKGLSNFFSTFKMDDVIHSISEAIKTGLSGLGDIIANLEWDKIGPAINDALIAFFTNISEIIDAVPWYEIGDAVKKAIEDVNWDKVWKGVVASFKKALGGFNEFLSGLTGLDVSVFEDLEKAIVAIGVAITTYKIIDFFSKLGAILGGPGFLMGAKVIGGIAGALMGLDLVIKGVKEMIESPSWKAFWDTLAGIALVIGGIALALGAWVPAMVAAVVSLVSMIAAYIAENWDAVVKWWDDVVATVSGWFSEMWNSISTWWSDLLHGIGEWLDGIVDSIKTWWNDVKTWWNDVKTWWGQKFDEFAKWVDEKLVQPVLQFIENMKTGIAEKMGDIKGVFGDVKTWIGEKVNNIKEAIKPVADWIYNKLIKPVQDKFNGMKNKFSDIWDSIKTKWNNLWEDGLWGGSKKIINKMLGGAESFVNGIVGGINGLSSGIRKVGNKIFDIIGVDITFDPISKVSIPKLATGTNEIPNEGLYHLHPGEAVVPKKYNPALGNGGNDEMVAKMDTLIDIMNNMSFTNVVNIGNKKIYEGQQAFNKTQQNKYGTIDLY